VFELGIRGKQKERLDSLPALILFSCQERSFKKKKFVEHKGVSLKELNSKLL
jgi:hypothetical protein